MFSPFSKCSNINTLFQVSMLKALFKEVNHGVNVHTLSFSNIFLLLLCPYTEDTINITLFSFHLTYLNNILFEC